MKEHKIVESEDKKEYHFTSGITLKVPNNIELEKIFPDDLVDFKKVTLVNDGIGLDINFPSGISVRIHPSLLSEKSFKDIIIDATEIQPSITNPKKIIFHNGQSPGDICMLTSAIRDLHKAYPGKYITDVRTPCSAIWENNPFITELKEDDPEAEHIHCDYPLIHNSNQGPWHFSQGFTDHLSKILKINVPFGECRGDIYVSDLERSWINQVEETTGKKDPFWIIVSGGKSDFTAKWFNAGRLQQVVDKLKDKIQFVQIGEDDHNHPSLNNVIDLRGKTDLRQLIRLVYHSSGVICPVTLLMHLAASVPVPENQGRLKNRPCIVIAGGREPLRWEAYTWHQYIHACGAYPCCDDGGCWKSRVIPIGDNDDKDHNNLCEHIVRQEDNTYLPKCLDSITPEDIIRRIETYLEGVEMWRNWEKIREKTLFDQEKIRKKVCKSAKKSENMKTWENNKKKKDKIVDAEVIEQKPKEKIVNIEITEQKDEKVENDQPVIEPIIMKEAIL